MRHKKILYFFFCYFVTIQCLVSEFQPVVCVEGYFFNWNRISDFGIKLAYITYLIVQESKAERNIHQIRNN